MKKSEKLTAIKGYNLMKESSIAICSIVRDCNRSLKRNIPIIEKLRANFKSSFIIIFENDSKDDTKLTLKNWSKNSDNVIVKCETLNEVTILKHTTGKVNKYFSDYRISKMATFRNQYMSVLQELQNKFDYIIVVDLDIEKFYLDGIAHSFGLADQWDSVSSYGYSYSPFLRKRYHDSYALTELGDNLNPQNEETIINNQIKWSFLKPGLPLIPVYSGFGGLAIYKYNAIKDKKYLAIKNNDPRVEVRCEHYSICHQMHKDNHTRVFINPNMRLLYQRISFSLIKKFIIQKLLH